jgi:hypothetical protein
MSIKLAIIFNENKLSGKLTKFWTGCYAYHAAWVDLDNNKMYDMNLLRRRQLWPHYGAETSVLLFDAPGNVTAEYLESQLETDESRYGVFDYCLFALRPLFHLFGQSTRNAGGVICSEMVNQDIWECGGVTPFHPMTEPPSPCDLYRWIKNKKG